MKRDKRPRLKKVLKLTNKIMSHPMFHSVIEEEIGIELSRQFKQLLKSKEKIDVVFYRPWWRWSRVNAYEQEGIIYLNERKFWKRSIDQWAFTVIHEITHVFGYSHNGNFRTKENLESVPYKTDSIAEHVWKTFIRS